MFNWDKKDLPTKASLDSVTTDIPVLIIYYDGNTNWLNSKALELGGITKHTVPQFGSLEKDTNGDLTGIIYGCHGHELELAYTISETEWPLTKQRLLTSFAENGITSVGDLAMSAVLSDDYWIYQRLLKAEKDNELTIRVHIYPALEIKGGFEEAEKMNKKYDSSFLKFSGLKQYVDGTTAFYTSLLIEPYSDKPGELGSTHFPKEFFMKNVPLANKEGFSVRLHSIGDGSTRIALDAMEKSAATNDMENIKNCIEHVEIIHPDVIDRFKKLDVIASSQPMYLIQDDNEVTSRIGAERAKAEEWPHRNLLNAGAILAFSTDHPFADLNPMLSVYAAVTRCNTEGKLIGSSPEQVIELHEALRAYTLGSAYAINREKDLGTLETGKLADIIVLDADPFKIDQKDLFRVKPILTMIDGKIIYQL